MTKPHSARPPKPPKRSAPLGNPFDEPSSDPAGPNPAGVRRSLNPFISSNPFDDDDEVELHYVTSNPFIESAETGMASQLPTRPLPPLPPPPPPQLPQKPISAAAATSPDNPRHSRPQKQQKPLSMSAPATPSPTRYFSQARRSGYNPFSSEEIPSSVIQLEDDEEEEALQAARTMRQQKEREQEQRYSNDQRNKFRKSLHRLENRVDRSGENASVHCIDPNRENSVIRFLLSKRVFGYPGTTGTLFSNYKHFVMNNHPLLSMLLLHPKNVYSRKQRLIVYLNALFFALFVSFVLLGTTTVHQVSVCRLGCNLSEEGNSTALVDREATLFMPFLSTEDVATVPNAHFALQSSSDNSTYCIGGYNDGMLYSSYKNQCQYYYPWLISLVSGLFVTVYSSLLEFLATCSCVQGHRSCQLNVVGRTCKSFVEICGGSALALCTVISSILMLYAILGSIVLQSDSYLIVNTLYSKMWASVEWFVYSLPYFSLKYPTDKRRFYEDLRAKERRASQKLEAASPA